MEADVAQRDRKIAELQEEKKHISEHIKEERADIREQEKIRTKDGYRLSMGDSLEVDAGGCGDEIVQVKIITDQGEESTFHLAD